MLLHRKLLIFAILVTFIPYWVQAQDKQRKFEINVGVSSPGLHCRADRDIDIEDFDFVFPELDETPSDYYYRTSNNSDKQLYDLYLESYKSTLYPGLSIETSYKLADSGFLKRLTMLGMAGFQMVDLEDFDITTNGSFKEKARRIDLLVGLRLNIINSRYFNMYSQFLLGGDICDNSRYWKIVEERTDVEKGLAFQLTYLGLRAKIGRRESGLGVMVEFGHGTMYSTSKFPLIPGIRTGVSYLF